MESILYMVDVLNSGGSPVVGNPRLWECGVYVDKPPLLQVLSIY